MRILAASGLALILWAALGPTGLAAQGLPLKRDLPPLPADACEASNFVFQAPSQPSPEAVTDAERLASDASEAAILGEYERARSLLSGAAALDGTSPSISYSLARLLEDNGDLEAALAEFCRFRELGAEPADLADAEGRIERIGTDMGLLGDVPARAAFEEGIQAFDTGAYDEAVQAFSRALVESPDWDLAHFNRGLAYLRSGRDAAGEADLEWYIELDPDAPDRVAVEAELGRLGPEPVPTYSAGTALATGLVIPGMGYFYTGRPALGVLALGAAGASIGFGMMYKKIEVSCLALPVGGQCPAGQELSRTETRPLLIPGLAVAGAITILGAIHAYRGARSSGFQASVAREVERLNALVPRVSLDTETTALRIEPTVRGGTGAVRARLEVRF